MNGFTLVYHSLVIEKDLPKIDRSHRSRIQDAIEQKLIFHPERYGKPLQETLKGLYSLRVGDYRVIYKICGNEIWIVRIGHRREVYPEKLRLVKS